MAERHRARDAEPAREEPTADPPTEEEALANLQETFPEGVVVESNPANR